MAEAFAGLMELANEATEIKKDPKVAQKTLSEKHGTRMEAKKEKAAHVPALDDDGPVVKQEEDSKDQEETVDEEDNFINNNASESDDQDNEEAARTLMQACMHDGSQELDEDTDSDYEENLSAYRKKKRATSTKRKAGNSLTLKTTPKGRPWTKEEEETLVRLVNEYGMKKWSLVSSSLEGRSGKQCRERWLNHLRPDITRAEWTEAEERVLIQAHAKLGTKWSALAKLLPARTENAIKNHWNATLRCKNKHASKVKKSTILRDYLKQYIMPNRNNAAAAANNNNTSNGGKRTKDPIGRPLRDKSEDLSKLQSLQTPHIDFEARQEQDSLFGLTAQGGGGGGGKSGIGRKEARVLNSKATSLQGQKHAALPRQQAATVKEILSNRARGDMDKQPEHSNAVSAVDIPRPLGFPLQRQDHSIAPGMNGSDPEKSQYYRDGVQYLCPRWGDTIVISPFRIDLSHVHDSLNQDQKPIHRALFSTTDLNLREAFLHRAFHLFNAGTQTELLTETRAGIDIHRIIVIAQLGIPARLDDAVLMVGVSSTSWNAAYSVLQRTCNMLLGM